MTKAELIEELKAKTGYSKDDLKEIIDNMITLITQEVARGKEVHLRGLGRFTAYLKKKGKIPKRDGTIAVIPEGFKPKFIPSEYFNRQVNDNEDLIRKIHETKR